MSKIKLDLKEFSHHKSDGYSTTLKHKHGHTITLAHKMLSKENQEQLKALAGISKDTATEVQKQEGQDQKPTKMAEGGMPKRGVQDTSGYEAYKQDKAPAQQAQGQAPMPNDETARKAQVKRISEEQKAYQQAHPEEFAQGGRVQMAEGGAPNPAEIALQSVGVPAVPFDYPEKKPMDPEMAAKQDFYNKQVEDQRMKASMMGGYPMETSDQVVFKDGKPPAQFSPEIAQQAQAKYEQHQQDMAKQGQAEYSNALQYNQQAQQFGAPEVPVPGVQPADQAAGNMAQTQPNLGQVASQMLPGIPDPASQMMSGMEGALKMQEQGARDLAKAQGELGVEQAAVQQKAMSADNEAKAALSKAQTHYEADFNAALTDYKNGMVDPERYWKGDPKTGEGSHSKILTGIGMIIAGFNPTGSPNAAIQFLNQQMDRSIQAQSKNLQARDSILHANMDHFKNVRDGVDATRIMMLDAASHELQMKAAQAQGPLAKAAMMTNLAAIQKERAQLGMQFSMRRAIMDLTTNQNRTPGSVGRTLAYIEQMNPEEGKRLRARYIPSMDALAQIDVTPEMRNKVETHQKMSSAIDDLRQFVKTHNTLIPGTPDYVTGALKAEAFKQAIREAKLGGVFKESEGPLLDKFINDNPAGIMKNFNTMPQLKELEHANHREFDILTRTLGLPNRPQAAAQDPKASAMAWAKANPKDPRAAKIMKALGQ